MKPTTPPHPRHTPTTKRRQLGSAMVEFILVAPVMTMVGTGVLQYSLLFNAKNLVNQASFMAVRAGSMGNASLGTVESAYTRALIPLYGGGRDNVELATSYARSVADTAGNAQIEMLNPIAASFTDYNDPTLQAKYNVSTRIIPNSGQAFKAATINANSAQSVQDANMLKLRITHGYEPKIPFAGPVIQFMMRAGDDGTDAFKTALYNRGRIPIVTHVTVQMQSDVFEPANPVQVVGSGTNGSNGTPAATPTPTPPCTSCSPSPAPAPSPGTGAEPQACPVPGAAPGTTDLQVTLPGDINFAFGSATLSAAGRSALDSIVTNLGSSTYDGIEVDGYTDNVGTPAYNATLSQNRANAARTYLISRGIPANRITAVGHGSTNPVCADVPASSGCRAQNRRVTVTVRNPN